MNFSEEGIAQLTHQYGFGVIFVITLLGNIGLPVPEETTVLLAGMAAHQGYLDLKYVLAVCIVSAICGDNLGYLIGYTGGRRLLIRYGKVLGITELRIAQLEAFFQKHG